MRRKHFSIRRYRLRICTLAFLMLAFLADVGTVRGFSSDLINLAAPTEVVAPKAVVEREEENIRDLMAEARQLAADGRYADAIVNLTDAIRRSPRDAVLYFKRGCLYYLMLSAKSGMANTETSLPVGVEVSYPEVADILSSACPSVPADCCDRALADFKQAIALKANYDIFYYMQGVLFSSDLCPQRDLWKAISEYDRALGINAGNAVYHLERGLVWAKLNFYREAVSNIDQAILLAPANYYYHREKGLIREKMGLLSEAATSYKAALALAPSNRLSDLSRDLNRARKGNCVDLIADYAELIVKRPAFDAFYINRALCYGDLKKYTQAIKDMTTALALKNDRRDLYFMRGKLYEQGGWKTEARRDFEKACGLNHPAACNYTKILQTEISRGDRWVPFWYSRDNRQYFYDRNRIDKKDGTRKVVRVRIESNDNVDQRRLVSDVNVKSRERSGYTLEAWEFDCRRAQFRIVQRQRLDREGKTVMPKDPLKKAPHPVSSGGISDRLFRSICSKAEEKGTAQKRISLR